MAGSNGSSAHRGGQAPQTWPPETEEQVRALEYARWQQQQAQQGYAPEPAQQQPPHQQATGYAQPAPGPNYGYDGQPPQAGFDPNAGYAPQGHAGAPQYGYAQPQHGYVEPAAAVQPRSVHAPQFERFAPAQQAAPDAYGRFAPAGPTSGYAAADPHDPHALGVPHDPRGYQQPGQHHGAPAYPGGHDGDPRLTQARADVQSWDLSNYAPGQIPPGYGGHAGVQGLDARGQPLRPQAAPGGHDAQWQQPAGGAQWPQHGGQGHQGFDGAPQGHYQPRPGEPGYQPGGVPHDDGYDADDAMPPEEKRRGPGTLMIVGALVGAIAAGGGLAYGYKMMGGSVRDKGKPPIVKAEANPARTVPKDAGGKTMENANSKFLNRLATDAPPPTTAVANAEAASRTGDVDGTTKKVTSIPITLNRDGTLSPAPSRPPEPPAPANSGVPGLLIDGLGPPPGAAVGPPLRGASGSGSLPQPGPAGPTVRAVPQPPPLPPPPAVKAVTPKVADLPLPKVISQPPPAAAEPTGPPKVARTPVPKKPAPTRDDLLASQGGAAAVAAPAVADGAVRKGSVVATGASGYVAVLASKKSRQDALNSFADLHQKYPDLLNGMTPDVREADLKDKGLWYRLIVGPPGSQQAARGLCVKLSERGMKDCWPVAY